MSEQEMIARATREIRDAVSVLHKRAASVGLSASDARTLTIGVSLEALETALTALSLPTPNSMLDLILRLHADGTLSEGQVAQATGLDRIKVRELADERRGA